MDILAQDLKEISIFGWEIGLVYLLFAQWEYFFYFYVLNQDMRTLALFIPALFGLFIFVLGRKKNLEELAA